MKTQKRQQTAEHIAKRIRRGTQHHAWKGDKVSDKGGRSRALRLYPSLPPCVKCGCDKAERHHIDGDTSNNAPSNILPICRKCHMKSDGRYEAFRDQALSKIQDTIKAAAKARKQITRCPRGHEYTKENTYVSRDGKRSCRICVRMHGKNYMERLRERKIEDQSPQL